MRIFDFFTKRKQKHSVSVDAVKEQNNVLLERLEKVESELSGFGLSLPSGLEPTNSTPMP